MVPGSHSIQYHIRSNTRSFFGELHAGGSEFRKRNISAGITCFVNCDKVEVVIMLLF